VKFQIRCILPPAIIEQRRRDCRRRKLPRIAQQKIHGRTLALCGGGPSLADHLDEIRSFDEVWAINEAAHWLKGQGIKATLFTVDPLPMAAEAYDVESAIFSTAVDPIAFEYMAGRDVRLFDSLYGGPTSASRAPQVALKLGFGRVTFFGCEGSIGEVSHVYGNLQNAGKLVVRCGGEDYLTQPDYYTQSQYLAEFICDHPGVFAERSGGLLAAMCRHADHQVIALAPDLKAKLPHDEFRTHP
jgi:hypothetical protein